ncbi:MAG: hypothetical protein O2887_12810 [Bacteroidetes bacterium]|nr:hypothetical protein [Bacteroidota bacterium]MDA1121349.1 hypothetical protein [Bacteroidota bacterium]
MRYLFLLIISACVISGCNDKNEVSQNVIASESNVQSNNIRNYLKRVSRELTAHSLNGISSIEWNEIRPERYEQFLEIVMVTEYS